MGGAWTLRGKHEFPAELAALVHSFPRRSLLSGGLAAIAYGLLPRGTATATLSDEADTSPQARDEAIQSLPLSELTAETRRKLMAVCERPTIFRRLPQKSIACDPALYVFLIRNPE